ncbi:MAG: type II toxin-antitoxin system RelE/ParE family toxin [Nanoarchaeota archaeon]|nr:type II toxin-antitoxin system RelE/ParE family toxin [Nanoarchaeota archaeon]
MFKGKPTKVIITGSAKEEFEELNMLVGAEIARGVTKSDHQTLLNSIKQKIELLRDNPEFGVHIPKDRIPKQYVINYDVNNLWKVNLSGAWRMIYTIKGSEVEIISLILDIMDHRDYSKKFGYRK